jgi:hypothetical protein
MIKQLEKASIEWDPAVLVWTSRDQTNWLIGSEHGAVESSNGLSTKDAS